jgi:hypothetical protein
MIVCPMCEHVQPEAGECEVCGKRLAGPGGGDAARVERIEGLEPTAHDAAAALASTPVDGLEPTAHAPAGAVAPTPVEVEPTRAAPLDVDAPAMDGVERTAAGIPGDVPTPFPVFVSCRYCRAPALPGERICGRCGMRLPIVAGTRGEAAAHAGSVCGCGALVRGRTCPACGARPTPA